MGGAATARERQAALRDRRRKDGFNYIHVWANADQEQAIKAFLANPTANPLHATRDSADAVLGGGVAGFQAKADYETKLAKVEETYRQYKAWADEADKRLEDIQRREMELAKRERGVKVASARPERSGDTNAVTVKTRTEALVRRFTTERDWRQAGATKLIDEPWTIEQRSKNIAALTARTKAVGTSLQALTQEFKDLLGEQEIAALAEAVLILNRIRDAASIAKTKTRALEQKIKEEAGRRKKQSHQVASGWLTSLPELDQVLTLCVLDAHQYDLDAFLVRKAFGRTQADRFTEVLGAAREAVAYEVERRLKAGLSQAEALQAVQESIARKRPAAEAKYRRPIEEAIAAVIAERLAKANGV